MELNTTQITNLARPFVGMVGQIGEFFKDPQNQQAFREWHLSKYGCYPKDEV